MKLSCNQAWWIVLFACFSFFSTSLVAQSYQAFSATAPWNHWIDGVSAGGLSNMNQGSSAVAKSSGNGGYGDYSNLDSMKLEVGSDQNLIVRLIGKHWEPTTVPTHLKVWIDLNEDGDFGDTDEDIYTGSPMIPNQNDSISYTYEAVLSIPNVPPATTRMRIAFGFVAAPTENSVNQGEGEDYTVHLVENLNNGGGGGGGGGGTTTGPCDTTFNLALGKPSYQSSTSEPGYAAQGNDGSRSGLWANPPGSTQSSWSQNPHWQVDLGQEEEIGIIKFFNTTSGNRTGAFKIFVTSDTTVFDVGYASYSTNSDILVHSTSTTIDSIRVETSIVGRYIRIQSSGNGFLSIGEVEAYGCTSTSTNNPEPTSPSLYVSVGQTSCPNAQDGTLSANATGGTSPYAFEWDDGSTAPVRTDMPVGFYSVTVTDAAGAQFSLTRQITPAVPFCDVVSTASATPAKVMSIVPQVTSQKPDRDSSYITDGSTAWPSLYNSDWEVDPQVRLPLGQEYIIDSIIIIAPTSGNQSQNIHVTTHLGVPPIDLAGVLSSANSEEYFEGNLQATTIVTPPAGTKADNIVLQRNGQGFIVLWEVTVIGHVEEQASGEVLADRIVWERIPPNLTVKGSVISKESFDVPQLKLRGCNVLPAGEDGALEFDLLSDPDVDGDSFYVGLIGENDDLSSTGTEESAILIKIYSSQLDPNNFSVTCNGRDILVASYDHKAGDWYQIRREGANMACYRNGELVVRFANTRTEIADLNLDFESLNLNPYLTIRTTGTDKKIDFKHRVSPNMVCADPYVDTRVLKYPTPNSLGEVSFTPRANSDMYHVSATSLENEIGLDAGVFPVTIFEPGNSRDTTFWIPEVIDPAFQQIPGGIYVTADSIGYSGQGEGKAVSSVTQSLDSGALVRFEILEDLLPPNIDPSADSVSSFRMYFQDANTGSSIGGYGIIISPFILGVLENGVPSNSSISDADQAYNFFGYTYDVVLRDGVFKVLKNGTEVYTSTYPASLTSVNLVIEQNGLAEINGKLQVSNPTPQTISIDDYVSLSEDFNGSVIDIDSEFRCYFRELYNVEANSTVQMEIKGKGGSVTTELALPDYTYGDNFHSIPFTLTEPGIYSITITGPNKGKSYRQLVRYNP